MAAPEIELVLLDVFTSEPFGGNQLAVAIDPPHLDGPARQRIANELNLAETIYLWPEADAHDRWRAAIHTPSSELPFAGHPTVGAAVALAHAGHVTDRVTLVEGVGDVDVEIDGSRATFTAAQLPARVGAPPTDQVAAALGLHPSQLHAGVPEPVSGWTAGVPFIVVVVESVDRLSTVRLDPSAWDRLTGPIVGDQLTYVVAPLDDPGRAGDWRARMFAPAIGITEDPATGSAATALAGALADWAPDRSTWTIHQGVEMGRRSRIDVALDRDPDGSGAVTAVKVGGEAVVMGSTILRIR